MDLSLFADLLSNFYGVKFNYTTENELVSIIINHSASEHPVDIRNINSANVNALLSKLKLFFLKNDNESREFKIVLKTFYEIAAMYSVSVQDFSALERYYLLLEDIYLKINYDFTSSVVIGLELFYLLTSNRIGDFHSMLELYPLEIRNCRMVAYVMELERMQTDGDFKKLLTNELVPPIDIYTPFISLLKDSTRYKVAACIECSFPSISVPHAAEMLYLDVYQMDEFVNRLNTIKFENGEPLWMHRNGYFTFENLTLIKEIPLWETLANTVSYATQLERIV